MRSEKSRAAILCMRVVVMPYCRFARLETSGPCALQPAQFPAQTI